MYIGNLFYLHNNYIMDSRIERYTAACVAGSLLSAPFGLSGMGTGCVLCVFVNALAVEFYDSPLEDAEHETNAQEPEAGDDLEENLDEVLETYIR